MEPAQPSEAASPTSVATPTGAGAPPVPAPAASPAVTPPPETRLPIHAPRFEVEFSTVHRSPILGAAVDTEHGLIAAISLEARFSVHDLSGTTLWSTRLGLAVDGGGAVRLGQGRFAMVWEGAGSWLWDLRTGRRLRRRQGIVFAHATALAAWMTDLEELCIEPLIPSPPDPFEESLCAHPTSIEGYPVLLAFSPDDAHLFASVSHHLALLRATEDTSVPGATIGAVVQESELGGEWCTATFAGDTIAALDRGGRAVILDASTLALRGERTLPPLGEDELETMLPDGPCVEAEVRIEEALALFRWHPGRPWVALDLASGAPRDVPSAMRARLPSTFADAVTVGTRRVALRSSGGEHAIHQLAFVSGGLVVLGREGALWVEEDGARPTTCLVGEVPLTRTRGGVRLVQGEGACDPTTDTGTASPPMPDDLDFVPEDPDVRSCSPDGADVCLLDREGERALVTRVRHRVLRRLDRDGEVRGASFSPDGSRVGLLMADGQVRVHRVEDGERIAAVPGTSIAAWSSSPTPSWLVTVLEADLLVHDLAGGQPVLRLSGATRAASDDTGSRLAYLRAPELHVIDWASRADSVVPASPPPSAQDLSFAGDRITLAGEGQLFSYALTGGAPLYLREVLSASDPSISPIVFHCPDEHTLRAIDLRTAQPLGDYPIACDSSLFYDGSIGTESFSHTSDGRILAYVDRREQVRLVRMSDGAELWLRLWSGPGTVHVVASALDGAFAVIAGGPEGFLLRDRLLPIGRARMVDPAHAEGLHRPTLVSDFFAGRPLPSADAAPLEVVPDEIAASRSLPGYGAEQAIDGALDTAWAVREAQRDWLEARFLEPTRLARLTLTTGYEKVSEVGDLFVLNAHARHVVVETDRGTTEHEIAEDQRLLEIPLEGEITRVRITVSAVWPGTRWQDLSLSELRFFAP